MAPAAAVASSLPPGYVIDSAIPIPEAIARFKRTVPGPAPATFRGTARSRDELLRQYLAALATRDTARLRDLVLTRAEFAHLYYPESRYTAPPFELDPPFLWSMINSNGEEGVTKALARFGGTRWALVSSSCKGTPAVEGRNRVHGPCTTKLRSPVGELVDVGLANEIVERDGIFKLTGFANEL